MQILRLTLLPALTVICLLNTSGCAPKETITADADPQAKHLELGRHLVEDIGLCSDCHTPRLANGELDRTKWLQGAPIGFKPLAPMPWAPVAPPLSVVSAYTDEQAMKFFTHGIKPNGQPPLPPMPGYRFTEDEARAVVTYLRSLSGVPTPAATR